MTAKGSPPKFLSIVGTISTGKSTLIKALDKYLVDAQIVLEPTQKWVETGILELFYSDPIKYAFLFQTIVYNDLVDQVCAAFEKQPNTVVSERNMNCSMIFWNLQQKTSIEDTTYRGMWTKWKTLMPEPTHYIFLDTPDIDVLMQRIETRNRDGEQCGISKDYQEKLMNAHREFYTHERFGDKLIILNAIDSTETNVEIIKNKLFI